MNVLGILYSLLYNSSYIDTKRVNLNEGMLIFENGLFIDISRNIKVEHIFFNEILSDNIHIRIGIFGHNQYLYHFAKIVYKKNYYETFIAYDLQGLLCIMNEYLIGALLQWFRLRITGDIINKEFIFVFDGKIENFLVKRFVVEYFYKNCKYKLGSLYDYLENFNK